MRPEVSRTGIGIVRPHTIILARNASAVAVRLWAGLEGLEEDYAIEAVSSPSGVTHVTFSRPGI